MKPLLTTSLDSFLGPSPAYYKTLILAFLLINPLLFALSPFAAGWALVIEFIFTLAMALRCYPLQAGGLLALEAIVLGMASPAQVYAELQHNLPVVLLLIFMVAGIHFMRELLLAVFTRLITRIRSKIWLALAFCLAGALLSAFLDALTVIAVVIGVASGFYAVYHHAVSAPGTPLNETPSREDLDTFRAFLRSLLMHTGVGTALGGICTLVGEPQNLIIAHQAGWGFAEFAWRMLPVSLPCLTLGLITCALLEKSGWFGYGARLPHSIALLLQEHAESVRRNRTPKERWALMVQALAAVWLITGLALHLAEVGLIGLSVLVLITAATGITEEHRLGHAFQESLPFTALLTVFFVIVAVISHLQLFAPVTQYVLSFAGQEQLGRLFLANGLLSMVSDNVFVGTIYITEMAEALRQGQISREQFDLLAVAINVGTNLPSIATPNGQAAFLFLLTSSLAPLVRLGYGRMVWMALPYTLIIGMASLILVMYALPPATRLMTEHGLIGPSSASPSMPQRH